MPGTHLAMVLAITFTMLAATQLKPTAPSQGGAASSSSGDGIVRLAAANLSGERFTHDIPSIPDE